MLEIWRDFPNPQTTGSALFLIDATLKEEQANHGEEQSDAETSASAASAS